MATVIATPAVETPETPTGQVQDQNNEPETSNTPNTPQASKFRTRRRKGTPNNGEKTRKVPNIPMFPRRSVDDLGGRAFKSAHSKKKQAYKMKWAAVPTSIVARGKVRECLDFVV
jgi:hypothetical protein